MASNAGDNRRPETPSVGQARGSQVGAGIAIGAGLGVAMGVAFDNLALGIAIGSGIGAAVGAALERTGGGAATETYGVSRTILWGLVGLGLVVLVGLVATLVLLGPR